jgi:hypothetical protein
VGIELPEASRVVVPVLQAHGFRFAVQVAYALTSQDPRREMTMEYLNALCFILDVISHSYPLFFVFVKFRARWHSS